MSEWAAILIGVTVEAGVGLACVILGLVLWKKQKISLLHEYHYSNVKPEDIAAYTRQMGIGLILIGCGILLTGVLNLFSSPCWWVSLFGGILAGLVVMHKAQKKYNGSWFG